jgi:hypothetical protein
MEDVDIYYVLLVYLRSTLLPFGIHMLWPFDVYICPILLCCDKQILATLLSLFVIIL